MSAPPPTSPRLEIAKRWRSLRLALKLSQEEFANILGVTQATASRIERGSVAATSDSLANLLCSYPDLDINELLCGQATSTNVDASDVAAHVRPIIRPLGDRLEDLPEEQVADDYAAVPLVEGRVAAGPGAVAWQKVRSLVWVYRPELGRRRRLLALQVSGDSMEPTVPDRAIVIIDLEQWEPRGQRRGIWALRTRDGDAQIKRLHRTNGELIVISDNFHNYPPEPAWTGSLQELVIGKVIWMWRSLE